MNSVFALKMLAVISLGLSTGAFAAETAAKKGAAATPAEPQKAAQPSPAAPAKPRPLPMNSRVDSIDAANKTFTMKRKDGVEVKHVLTATAEIKSANGPAKFSDIKVGDWVAGSRFKKSETEYEVVKITKFGPRAKKEDKKE